MRLFLLTFAVAALFGCDGYNLAAAPTGVDQSNVVNHAKLRPRLVAEYQVPTPASGLQWLTIDQAGNVWFTETGASKIGKLDPQSGVFVEYDTASANACPEDLAFGRDGNIWFPEACAVNGTYHIGRLNPSTGRAVEFALPTTMYHPSVIARGPTNAMWFSFNGGVGRISMSGTITDFSHAGISPNGIAVGFQGRIWFTDPFNNSVGWENTQGQFKEFPVPTMNSFPNFITLAPNHDLYFTEQMSNHIGRVTRDGVVTEFTVPVFSQYHVLYGISADLDGDIWFAQASDPPEPEYIGVLGRFGNVSTVMLPTSTWPVAVIATPDRKVYFAGSSSNAIGLIEY